MSGLFHTLTNWSPSKSKPSRDDGADDSEQQRGTKRKADPYDITDGGGKLQLNPMASSAHVSDDVSRLTPTARERSRVPSEAPSTSRSRASAAKIQRRSRSSSTRPTQPELNASAASPSAGKANSPVKTNGESAKSPVKGPGAEMGSITAEFPAAEDSKVAIRETRSPKKPIETDAEKLLAVAQEKEQEAEKGESATSAPAKGADDNLFEVENLLEFRRVNGGNIELLVKWVNEPESDASWEPEAEIQRGASETLYDFWKKKGGRSEVLFADSEEPEVYHIFKILRHNKGKPAFVFEIQWVGYSDKSADTTWEPEPKLKRIAPALLQEYWESVGGRDKFVSRRGKAAPKNSKSA
ncbi:hypothetical protein BX600DRAFT_109755 [Xylariales sp. PMI_506]|nr:hypothetical protein BX600DRAFT_109755 [Xylariales sp. PMI_506]